MLALLIHQLETHITCKLSSKGKNINEGNAKGKKKKAEKAYKSLFFMHCRNYVVTMIVEYTLGRHTRTRKENHIN